MLAAAAGCGTDAQPPRAVESARTTPPTAVQAGAQAIARRVDGLYTASIGDPALREALPTVHVPAGRWTLRIDVRGRTVQLFPPEGGDITLRLSGVGASRLRLAPDTACESPAGRTATSQFTWLRTGALLRLQSVHAPCRSDATILTTAPWRAAWPTATLTPPSFAVDAN